MKREILYSIAAVAASILCFTACTKENKPDRIPDSTEGTSKPDDSFTAEDLLFDVTVEKLTWNAGEEITFSISGNAQEIRFWSGEEGQRYAYRSGKDSEIKKLTLEFSNNISKMGGGENRSCERKLFVSNNFSGDMTTEAIRAADWSEISSVNWAPSTTLVSTNIDIRPNISKNSHIAFMFKNGTWTSANSMDFYIRNIVLTAELEDGTTNVIADHIKFSDNTVSATAGFVLHDMTQAEDEFSSLVHNGHGFLKCTTGNGPQNIHEVWFISKSLNGVSIKSAPEQGEIIKYSYEAADDHTFSFAEAGVYKVSFVGMDLISGEEILRRTCKTVGLAVDFTYPIHKE